MHYNSRIVFWSACLGMLLFGIGLITLGSVATPLIARFHLSQIEAGGLFFILPFGILAGSLLFGPLCDTYGYKLVLIVSCIFMCAGFNGIAYSSSLSLLRICIFLFGVAGGAINGATNAVVADISSDNKGANLSLLGVFFAIGSISVPFILGMLQRSFSFERIISSISLLTVLALIVYIAIKFPQPKQKSGVSLSKMIGLISDRFLLLIAFYLFLVSSLEGIINNWTTSFLGQHLSVSQENALFALSSYVVGMAVMRIFLGSVFRNVNTKIIVFGCLTILLAGCVMLALSNNYTFAVISLVTMGVGLSAGFPLMLGLAGAKYTDVSATAFSFVLVIALAGNMLVNFLMGIIAEKYGIHHFSTIAICSVLLMFLLATQILKSNHK